MKTRITPLSQSSDRYNIPKKQTSHIQLNTDSFHPPSSFRPPLPFPKTHMPSNRTPAWKPSSHLHAGYSTPEHTTTTQSGNPHSSAPFSVIVCFAPPLRPLRSQIPVKEEIDDSPCAEVGTRGQKDPGGNGEVNLAEEGESAGGAAGEEVDEDGAENGWRKSGVRKSRWSLKLRSVVQDRHCYHDGLRMADNVMEYGPSHFVEVA